MCFCVCTYLVCLGRLVPEDAVLECACWLVKRSLRRSVPVRVKWWEVWALEECTRFEVVPEGRARGSLWSDRRQTPLRAVTPLECAWLKRCLEPRIVLSVLSNEPRRRSRHWPDFSVLKICHGKRLREGHVVRDLFIRVDDSPHVLNLFLETLDLFLLLTELLGHVCLSSRQRLLVLVQDPEPLLVELEHCTFFLTEDLGLKLAVALTVDPLVEVDEGDVEGVAIRRLLLHHIDSIHVANLLEAELFADELSYSCLVLLLRHACNTPREGPGITARDIKGHLVVELVVGSHHGSHLSLVVCCCCLKLIRDLCLLAGGMRKTVAQKTISIF